MTLGTLARYHNPARRVVRRDFDRIMDDLWSGFGLAPLALGVRSDSQPSFEAVELETEYSVSADIPGVEPEDLDVTVEDGVLAIQGHRHDLDETPGEDAVERAEECGRFERRIRFPGEIVEGEVRARYKNGVLRVTIPKPKEVKPEARSVSVETA